MRPALLDREWTQAELHTHARKLGIFPDPHESIPQGIKYIAWPQPPLTEAEKAWALSKIADIQKCGLKPLAVIRRVHDCKSN
jgi:hypothetical protein